MMPESDLQAHVAGELERKGLCVVAAFMPVAEVAALAAECRALNAHTLLQPAAVGRGAARRHEPALRGDRTFWFDRGAPTPAQSHYWSPMQMLQQALNRRL